MAQRDDVTRADDTSTSLKHLKELQGRKTRIDLRAARERIDKEQPIQTLKIEKNAILSIFIEDVWKLVDGYRRINPLGIVEPRTSAEIAVGGPSLLTAISAEELERRCRAVGDYPLVVEQLDECTRPVVFAAIREWCERRFERLRRHVPESIDASDRIFARFLNVQQALTWNAVDEPNQAFSSDEGIAELMERVQPAFVFGAVSQGFITAREVIWGTLAVAPVVFERQYGKRASAGEMAELASSLRPLVLMLAADDLESHVSIAEWLMLGPPTEGLRPMDPRMFFIAKPRGKLTLEIDEQILRSAALAQIPDEPRTGCPALHSLGATGKNVVSELYEWYIDLARRFSFPHIERLRTA